MIQINGVEITENLVAILNSLGLGEKSHKDDRNTYYYSKTLIKVNDFFIDYMTMKISPGDMKELKEITELLIAIKEIRDSLMSLDAEFNNILKLY